MVIVYNCNCDIAVMYVGTARVSYCTCNPAVGTHAIRFYCACGEFTACQYLAAKANKLGFVDIINNKSIKQIACYYFFDREHDLGFNYADFQFLMKKMIVISVFMR